VSDIWDRLRNLDDRDLRWDLVIDEAADEGERLREENDQLKIRIGTYYAGNPDGGIVKRLEDEIERLREEWLACHNKSRAKGEEIEKLRNEVRKQCKCIDDLRFYVDTAIERNGELAEENKRLRGLLREGADGIENSIQSPACIDWMRRVREALGDVPDA